MNITYHYPGMGEVIFIEGIRQIGASLDYATGTISYMLLYKSGQADRLLLPITTTIVIGNED